MIQHGVNMTASDMKNMLESTSRTGTGGKTWEQLFANSGMNYQNQSDALLSAYGDTIAQAYKSNLEQQAAMYDLGLSNRDTAELQKFTRKDLLDTYNTYLSNYSTAQNKLATTYAEESSLYNEALTGEAENYAALFNHMNDYYTNVLANATTQVNTDVPIYEGKGKNAKIIGYETETRNLRDEYGLDWLYDDEGNAFTKDQIMNILFDENGQITDKGKIYYDMIFNNNFAGTYSDSNGNPVISFDEWLSNNDNALYNWYHEGDPFNYTELGTKLGTAKELVGLNSKDEKFVAYQDVDSAKRYLKNMTSDTQTKLEKLGTDLKIPRKIELANELNFNYLQDLIDGKGGYTGTDRLQAMSTYRNSYERQLTKAGDAVKEYRDKSLVYLKETYENLVDKLSIAIDDDILSSYEDKLKSIMTKYSQISTQLPDTYKADDANGFEEIRKKINDAYSSISVNIAAFNNELQSLIDKLYAEQAKRS